jgi:hypothetical protein
MSEVQEQELGGMETMSFGNTPMPKAEEPEKQEAPAEEHPEKEEETPVAEETEPAKEEAEKAEDGAIVVNFDEDGGGEQKQQTEDVEAYKTRVADLEAQIAKLSETPKLDPRIEKLNQIIQNGGDINQSVWEMQSKDYAAVNISDSNSALEVLKDKLKYIDGDDQELVNFYLDKNYPVLRGKKTEDDFDSDGEFAAQKREEEMVLRKEAKGHLGSLKEFQEKMRLPEAPNHQYQKQQEEALRSYQAEATTKLNEIQQFDVELDAETKLRFPFVGEGKEFAKSIIANPENQSQFFISRYAKDGKVDYQSFAEDMWFLNNRPKVFNHLFAQGKSAGKKEAIKELQGENAAYKTNEKPQKRQVAESDKGFAQMTFSRPRG